MQNNPHVKHPKEIFKQCKKARHWIITKIEKLLDIMGEIALPSIPHTIVALILPLIVMVYVILSPDGYTTKILVLLVTLIAQTWIQWWALPALQRLQVKADAKRDAKADADHEAMTHIANQVDELRQENKELQNQNVKLHTKLDKVLQKLNDSHFNE